MEKRGLAGDEFFSKVATLLLVFLFRTTQWSCSYDNYYGRK